VVIDGNALNKKTSDNANIESAILRFIFSAFAMIVDMLSTDSPFFIWSAREETKRSFKQANVECGESQSRLSADRRRLCCEQVSALFHD